MSKRGPLEHFSKTETFIFELRKLSFKFANAVHTKSALSTHHLNLVAHRKMGMCIMVTNEAAEDDTAGRLLNLRLGVYWL
jgi:hypothetical protein